MSRPEPIDSAALPWLRGSDVVAAFAPEWGANLGPPDAVAAAYERFELKPIYEDWETGRRMELIRCAAGYADVTHAYHDTVEECLVLEGACAVTGEGELSAGSYFWRPPGYVHAASTSGGFTALMAYEGVNAADASGPVTRRVRPAMEAGTNALHEDPGIAGGPRGWVRCLATELLSWVPLASEPRAAALGGFDPSSTEVKVLSWNPDTRALSALARVASGGRAAPAGEHELFVLSGALDGAGAHTYLCGPAVLRAGPDGALVFVKANRQAPR